MDGHWLWPFQGGTGKERLWAMIEVLELLMVAAGFYVLTWALAPYV